MVLIHSLVWGQSTEPSSAPKKPKRIEIGVVVSPDLTYRILCNRNGDAVSNYIEDDRNAKETPKPGVTAGFTFGYRFTQAVGIETGIMYSDKGYQAKKRGLTYGDMIDPRYGFVYSTSGTNSPTKVRFVYDFHYVGIPVKANFRFGGHQWKGIATIGAIAEFLTASTNTAALFYENGPADRSTEMASDDFKVFNLSATVSAGVEYTINESMSVRVEPTFRFGALPIIDAPITSYLYSAGLQIGYYYRL